MVNDKNAFNSPWLSGLPHETMAAFRASATTFSVPAGQRVTEIGDVADSLIGITTGFVAMHTDDENQQDLIAHVFGPGDWFGIAAILSETPRFLGSSALTDVRGVKISKSAIEHVAVQHPKIWRSVAVLAGLGTAIAVQAGRDGLIKSPTERCLATLRRLAGRQSLPCTLPLTQTQLAQICGLSRGAVAKALREMESNGSVSRGYSSITLN